MRGITLGRIGCILIVVALAACGKDADPAPTAEPLNAEWRLGLVTNVGGTISDGGFSESAHLGALRAVDQFHLDYAYGVSRDENDYQIQIDQHLDSGRNIIVTVGYQMEAVTLENARQHPDVYFIGVDQSYGDADDLPPNIIGLQFADDEASFVAGALAGLMTGSDVVGVIGGMEIPPVVRLAEGFRNGAQYVNPAVSVLIVYTGSFDNGELGADTAADFIRQGADVIFGAAGTTGYGGIQYAARQGAWVIGVDQDEWRTNFLSGDIEGADRVLTSAIKRIDNGVYQAVESIVTGEPESGVVVLSTADCGVGYAPFHEAADAIPASVQDTVEAIWRALAAGTLETGADGQPGASAPESLAPGALPVVPDDAPRPADCDYS